MADLWKETSALADFDDVLNVVNYPSGAEDVELLLSLCQMSLAIRDDAKIRRFLAAAEKRIVSRCRFVTAKSDLSQHEVFLRRVARRSTRLPRMMLFTTNYDLAFEEAGARAGFVVVDGFSFAEPRTFDGVLFDYDIVKRGLEPDRAEFVPNVFQLAKLHGSVDWEERDRRFYRNREAVKPALIYPRQSKYELSYATPFIEMMSRFQLALRTQNTALLIVGFGFHDAHLTEPIMNAIRTNVGLRVVVVSPGLATSTSPHIAEMTRLIDAGDPRIALVATSFEDILAAIPDLTRPSETEEHRARVDQATT